MDLYAENILDHYRHPRNKGEERSPTVTHKEENASCGDDLVVDLVIEDGRVSNVLWRGQGCAISQAAISLLSEELKKKSTDEVMSIDTKAVRDLLGVPIGIRREKCAFLGLHAVKNAIRKAQNQDPQSWRETIQIDK
ncbi:MAG: iron-sulfur cluster assembly scaffold protein [Candidatus Peribacteraceae bacterium]